MFIGMNTDMKDCVVPELGHLWERVTMPRKKGRVVTATVACVREGCDEVGYEFREEPA